MKWGVGLLLLAFFGGASAQVPGQVESTARDAIIETVRWLSLSRHEAEYCLTKDREAKTILVDRADDAASAIEEIDAMLSDAFKRDGVYSCGALLFVTALIDDSSPELMPLNEAVANLSVQASRSAISVADEPSRKDAAAVATSLAVSSIILGNTKAGMNETIAGLLCYSEALEDPGAVKLLGVWRGGRELCDTVRGSVATVLLGKAGTLLPAPSQSKVPRAPLPDTKPPTPPQTGAPVPTPWNRPGQRAQPDNPARPSPPPSIVPSSPPPQAPPAPPVLAKPAPETKTAPAQTGDIETVPSPVPGYSQCRRIPLEYTDPDGEVVSETILMCRDVNGEFIEVTGAQ